MYQTDASYGNVHEGHGHFHARRSKNLVDWQYLGGTMPEAPAWVKDSLNAIRGRMNLEPIDNPRYGYWAPVARNIGGGKYRLYYSIVVDNYIRTGAANTAQNFDNSWTERAFIGLMESTDPAGNQWVDKGYVVCSSTDKGKNDYDRPDTGNWEGYFKYNAIDPTYLINPEGEHWLAYGSWHSGFALLQLDPVSGKPLQQPDEPWNITDESGYGIKIASRGNSRWQGSEAPELIYNEATGYYYLFMAYDGLDIPYNTRVARSRTITGPYYGMDGSNALSAQEVLPVVTHPYKFNDNVGWVGFSHCCIFNDGAGNWYYASQARFPSDVPGINASNAIMMGHVRAIRWTSDGWPLVMSERYGDVPKVTITKEELIGDWQHIDMSYSYGRQKTATIMTLADNGKVTTGTWAGSSWSYDAATQVLTVNNQKLYLSRECDWEAAPRTHTLVYSAYGTNHKSYWGKKVK